MADPGAQPDVERFLKRYQRAKERFDKSRTVIDECYEFGLPLRERSYCDGGEGARRTDRLFDSTAVGLLQDLASQMLDDVWPADAKPFELEAGPDVPPAERPQVNRALSEVAAEIVETVNNSNFRSAAHEALMDWGIATGFLLPEEGDALQPVRFRCLPLTEAMPDLGPFDEIDALFRPRKVRAADIPLLWPGAAIDQQLERCIRDTPDERVDVVEGSERDWTVRATETWRYSCVLAARKHVLKSGKHEGFGSKPFIDFSSARVTGEVLGRGQMQVALPDIKTLNLVKQLVLENADLAISGLWQYDDDGVLNPDTIQILPGTTIPRVQGSRGLEPLQTPGDFNVGDLIIKDLQGQIRSIFFGDDLGPPKNTPMSATEVLERSSNRARRRAGPYQRLIVELLFQTVRRVSYILVRQGRIKLPAIDGRRVVFRPLSPLTRAQAQDEILRHDRYLEMLNMRLGPQVTATLFDFEKYGEWLARKIGVEPSLVRTQGERKQMVQAVAQLAQTAQAAGTAA